MHPRPTARRRRRRLLIHALQACRLQGLATGAFQPRSEREALYLALVQGGHAPVLEDFVLSEPLLLLEAVSLEADRQGWHGPDDG